MIVADVETTGLNPKIHQILSIGAVDYNTGDTFYGECRIYKRDKVDPVALSINGFTEERIRSHHNITPKQLYKEFLDWATPRSNMLGTCNISFDLSFLRKVHSDSGLEFSKFPFRRNIDLYTVAYCKFKKTMGLKAICEELNIEPEPPIHNALNGAIKASECFKALLT